MRDEQIDPVGIGSSNKIRYHFSGKDDRGEVRHSFIIPNIINIILIVLATILVFVMIALGVPWWSDLTWMSLPFAIFFFVIALVYSSYATTYFSLCLITLPTFAYVGILAVYDLFVRGT